MANKKTPHAALANDELMEIALTEARLATNLKEGPPFGAVIYRNGRQVIASAHNETFKDNDPSAHAEIVAIRKACKILKSTNLENCVLYASAEPCPMCVAACVQSGVKMIYFGASVEDFSALYHHENRIAANVKIRDAEFRATYMRQLMRAEACELFRNIV